MDQLVRTVARKYLLGRYAVDLRDRRIELCAVRVGIQVQLFGFRGGEGFYHFRRRGKGAFVGVQFHVVLVLRLFAGHIGVHARVLI
ncbi:hypothetical protein SDC9_182509 [bioreactor metagenome]|uniref:Uncharacterized protein n=1 Tax=bioreactor metagenome TaxID=1076179 RepID=A0A645H7P8_9ZZZZ